MLNLSHTTSFASCIEIGITWFCLWTSYPSPSFGTTDKIICFIKGAKDYISKRFGVNIEILSPPHLEYSKPNYSVSLALLSSAIWQEGKQKTNKFINFIKRITKR